MSLTKTIIVLLYTLYNLLINKDRKTNTLTFYISDSCRYVKNIISDILDQIKTKVVLKSTQIVLFITIPTVLSLKTKKKTSHDLVVDAISGSPKTNSSVCTARGEGLFGRMPGDSCNFITMCA